MIVRPRRAQYGDIFTDAFKVVGGLLTTIGGGVSSQPVYQPPPPPPPPDYTKPALIIGGTVLLSVIGYALIK